VLLHHPDAVFRREIGEEAAILGVVQAILQQFGGRATDGLAAATAAATAPLPACKRWRRVNCMGIKILIKQRKAVSLR